MVGAIDGFRWCILGGDSSVYWPGFTLSFTLVAFFLWWGVRQFRRAEKGFADLILKCCSNFGIAPIIDNKTTSCRVRIPVKPAITGLHNEVLILHGV